MLGDYQVQPNVVGAIITDCLKTNIYDTPDLNGEITAVIPSLSEVLVDLPASTEKFYKVCTAAGIEGFCVKRFAALCR